MGWIIYGFAQLSAQTQVSNQRQLRFDYSTKIKRPLRGQRPLGMAEKEIASVGIVGGLPAGSGHALDNLLGEVALGLKQLGHLTQGNDFLKLIEVLLFEV